jgi:hypothetical protein
MHWIQNGSSVSNACSVHKFRHAHLLCPSGCFFCLKYFKCLANFYHIIFMPEILTIVLQWLRTKGCFTVGPDLQVPTVIGCPMWLYFLTPWVRTYARSCLNLKWKPNSKDKSQPFFKTSQLPRIIMFLVSQGPDFHWTLPLFGIYGIKPWDIAWSWPAKFFQWKEWCFKFSAANFFQC